MAANDPAEQPLLTQMVEAPLTRVALAGGVNSGEPLGRAGAQVELLDGFVDLFRHHGADKAAKGDGGAVVDIGADGLLCGHDLGHGTPLPFLLSAVVLLSRRCGGSVHSFGKNGRGRQPRPA